MATIILAWGAIQTFACAETLPIAEDLARDAEQMAQDGVPMVVLYSQSGCPWCDQARAHLVPMAIAPDTGATAVFRQVDIDSDRQLADFNGRTTTHRRFGQVEDIRFTPVLVIYGPHGNRLVEPIIGVRLPDFYGQYVEQAIALGRQRMLKSH